MAEMTEQVRDSFLRPSSKWLVSKVSDPPFTVENLGQGDFQTRNAIEVCILRRGLEFH
jgi:hypothetical protein